jgi:hypothetical protein
VVDEVDVAMLSEFADNHSAGNRKDHAHEHHR